MTDTYSELAIGVAHAEGPAELASQFHNALLHLDVHVVCFAGSGEGAGAAKGPRPLEVGGLIARFALYRDLLRSIIHGARDWPGHWHARSVKLTLDGNPLELTGAPSALQDPLVEL